MSSFSSSLLPYAIRTVSDAVELDHNGKIKEAYCTYLGSIVFISKSLKDNAWDQDFGNICNEDTVKLLKLVGQCHERALDIVQSFQTKDVKRNATDAKRTQQTPHGSSPSHHGHDTSGRFQNQQIRRSQSESPSTPAGRSSSPQNPSQNQNVDRLIMSLPTPPKSGNGRQGSPKNLDRIQNQQIFKAYQRRKSLQSSTQQKYRADYNLGLLRKSVEDMAIERARRKALNLKLQERRDRLREKAEQRFAHQTGSRITDAVYQKKIYTKILEFEQETSWPQNYREKLSLQPENAQLIEEIVRTILRSKEHPIGQIMAEMQYALYKEFSLYVSNFVCPIYNQPPYENISKHSSSKSQNTENESDDRTESVDERENGSESETGDQAVLIEKEMKDNEDVLAVKECQGHKAGNFEDDCQNNLTSTTGSSNDNNNTENSKENKEPDKFNVDENDTLMNVSSEKPTDISAESIRTSSSAFENAYSDFEDFMLDNIDSEEYDYSFFKPDADVESESLEDVLDVDDIVDSEGTHHADDYGMTTSSTESKEQDSVSADDENAGLDPSDTNKGAREVNKGDKGCHIETFGDNCSIEGGDIRKDIASESNDEGTKDSCDTRVIGGSRTEKHYHESDNTDETTEADIDNKRSKIDIDDLSYIRDVEDTCDIRDIRDIDTNAEISTINDKETANRDLRSDDQGSGRHTCRKKINFTTDVDGDLMIGNQVINDSDLVNNESANAEQRTIMDENRPDSDFKANYETKGDGEREMENQERSIGEKAETIGDDNSDRVNRVTMNADTIILSYDEKGEPIVSSTGNVAHTVENRDSGDSGINDDIKQDSISDDIGDTVDNRDNPDGLEDTVDNCVSGKVSSNSGTKKDSNNDEIGDTNDTKHGSRNVSMTDMNVTEKGEASDSSSNITDDKNKNNYQNDQHSRTIDEAEDVIRKLDVELDCPVTYTEIDPQLKDIFNKVVKEIHSSLSKLHSLLIVTYDELDMPIGRDQSYASLEAAFFEPLWPWLCLLFRRFNIAKEGLLYKVIRKRWKCEPASFFIRQQFFLSDTTEKNTGDYPYRTAIEELRKITSYSTPLDKLECIVQTSKLICQCVKDYWERKGDSSPPSVGCDDLLPILTYVVVKAALPQLVSECHSMEEFIHENYLLGEEGYCLTTLSTAIAYVLNLATGEMPK